jgi:hypothetical protein
LLQVQSPLVSAFEAQPGWRRVYADAQAVIDARD